MGFVKEKTQSFSGSLLVLAGFAVLTAAAAMLVGSSRAAAPEAAPLAT